MEQIPGEVEVFGEFNYKPDEKDAAKGCLPFHGYFICIEGMHFQVICKESHLPRVTRHLKCCGHSITVGDLRLDYAPVTETAWEALPPSVQGGLLHLMAA